MILVILDLKAAKVSKVFKEKLGLLGLRVILDLKGLKDLKVELVLLGLKGLRAISV